MIFYLKPYIFVSKPIMHYYIKNYNITVSMTFQGAIVGMVVGLISMMFVGVQAYMLQQVHNFNPMLPTDLNDCPAGTDYSKAVNDTTKMYTLSEL